MTKFFACNLSFDTLIPMELSHKPLITIGFVSWAQSLLKSLVNSTKELNKLQTLIFAVK